MRKMGFWHWLRRIRFEPQLEKKDFISDAYFHKTSDAYYLRMKFSETVGDGSDVRKLNFRHEETGMVISSFPLTVGDKGCSLNFDPEEEQEWSIIGESEDGDILTEDVLKIRKKR